MTSWEIAIPLLVLATMFALCRFVGCSQIAGIEEWQGGPPPAQPPAGLVASWRLNEGPATSNNDVAKEEWDRHPGSYKTLSQSPQIAADSAPLPTTPLGTGPFAAPDGGFKAGVDGIIQKGQGTAVRFNGGFVRVFDPDPNKQGQLNPVGDFSLVAWVWPEAEPPAGDTRYRSVITSRFDDGQSKQGYMIYAGPDDPNLATPTFTWQAWVGIGASWESVIGPPVRFDVPAGLIITYNHASARLRLYHLALDENADFPETLQPQQRMLPTQYVPGSAQRPLYIGAGRTEVDEPQQAPNYWFLGLIQEVRVYDRELADAEIAGIFASGAAST